MIGNQQGLGYRLGRFVTRHYGLCAVLVVALMAGNVFLGLGSSSVNDFDEARYGVSAFEMQTHRELVITTYAGGREVWALKPPLGYWLMALSYSLLGGSALAMRVPSAICAVATVAMTMVWAGRWFGRRVAILSGLIVATTFGFISHHGARSGDFDSCLTLILAMVTVRLVGLGEAAWRVVLVAALLACGFLLKSFAIAPVVLIGAGYLLWSGDWRRQRLVPWLAAFGVFGLIVGGWALARWWADGSADFLVRMFREDVIGRSTSIVDKSTSSPLGYVTGLFDRFAPWPLVMIAAGGLALRVGLPRRLRRARAVALVVLWAAIPLTFFSLVRTQHHWYLDPSYPALAMLAAGSALFLVKRSTGRLRTVALVGLVALPVVLCEARVLARVLIKEPMSADQRFLRGLRPLSASGCREIRSTCQLLYSERFLLEVADGFEVVEPGLAAAPAAASAKSPSATCLLVGKSAWRRPPPPAAERLPPSGRLLAGNDSYALYRGDLTSAPP